ncbi:MAG: RNA-binding cell elongation regulator Jag/EloR [Actinomycetota bacterium]
MGPVEKSGANVEEALEAALKEMGVSEQEVEVEIVQEPKGGFLGLGSQGATVRVRLKRDVEELSQEDIDEQADLAADFLEDLIEKMGFEADVEINEDQGTTYVEIWGPESEEGDDDMALLIGRHGSSLDALQEIVRVIVGRRTGNRCRVMVDVEDYRKRRRARIVSKAKDIARRVQKTGRQETLEPMNPYERKIVHDAVASVGGGLETVSQGEEPERRVMVRRRR